MNDFSHLPSDLWPAVIRARRRLLMLDYDGTLAPLQLNRMEARIPERTRGALAAVTGLPSTRVAVVSGRDMRELGELTTGLSVIRVGEHGWSVREPEGSTWIPELSSDATSALAEAERRAVVSGFGSRLERKRTGLVLHLRGLPEDPAARLALEVRKLWAPITASGALRLDPIHGGLELKAAARNKGTAARELMDREGPEALPVYVGDDFNDEDAFVAVKPNGFGIRVGSRDQPTAATGWLPSVDAVADFLEEWLRVTGKLSHPAAS